MKITSKLGDSVAIHWIVCAASGIQRRSRSRPGGTMDGDRFDEFTRGLAGYRSRRAVLRTMAGSLAASLAALGVRSALAQTALPPTCTSDQDCANQGFVNHVCDFDGFGRRITCTCPSGFAPCNNRLCCPPSDTTASGSTCPPEPGNEGADGLARACVGQESAPAPGAAQRGRQVEAKIVKGRRGPARRRR